MRAFFAKETTPTKADNSVPFFINNCGFYRNPEHDLTVSRPRGREDYQIIFVSRGTLIANGTEIHSGGAYIFEPGQKQEYIYRAENKSMYYWVHFCGYESRKIVESCGAKGSFLSISDYAETERTFRLMVTAFENNISGRELLSVGCVLSLLALITDKTTKGSPFRRAEQQLRNCCDDVKISRLAENFGMSEAHFIRSFKSYNGVTPRAYALMCRIEHAKMLLSSTDMRIGYIAEACGFSDALYFSRAFKKITGSSPRDYRRNFG
ncbi:MAG TPA: hypothetical protein DHU65_04990 [Clostridiales bacterium]|nr:hypothetical protein [Clostridiales bacterium]